MTTKVTFRFPYPRKDSGMYQLINLALPVIATSFMSMAYNFINIIFVGKLGSSAVAAVGSAGFFINLSWGISSLLTVGAGIKVSHSIGKNDLQTAKDYIHTGLTAMVMLGLLYYLIILLSGQHLISFIKLNDSEIERSAVNYLMLCGISIPFVFQNLYFTNVFIGSGDSRSPFRINATAFGVNMLLDPILIFLSDLGIYGAAAGTVISQAFATYLFYRRLNQSELQLKGSHFKHCLFKNITILGVSPAVQRISFTIIAIFMARIISNWGASAIAVQKVGVQIEAISYMTAGGFMSALSSISGKAFGEGDYNKQWQVFKSGIMLALIIGIITSTIFIVFPEAIFSIFLNDNESLAMGREYLIILGFSQLFMCLEFMATGAFFGWGRTHIPAITGISLTALRIPMALFFIGYWQESLSSVWWSISISSIAKGVMLVTLYTILFQLYIKKLQPVRI